MASAWCAEFARTVGVGTLASYTIPIAFTMMVVWACCPPFSFLFGFPWGLEQR